MGLETIRVRVTIGDLEEFKSSIIWKDIKRELHAWKRGFESERSAIVERAATENPSTASVLMHMGDINGRIKAVDYMIGIPDMFISILESEKSKSSEPQQELNDSEEVSDE